MNDEVIQEKILTDRNSGLEIPKDEWRILGDIVGALEASRCCADFHRAEAQAMVEQQPVNETYLAGIEARLVSRRIHNRELLQKFHASLSRLAVHIEGMDL